MRSIVGRARERERVHVQNLEQLSRGPDVCGAREGWRRAGKGKKNVWSL